jgi:3D (Asp-Asp-Asp) domain-containing protein
MVALLLALYLHTPQESIFEAIHDRSVLCSLETVECDNEIVEMSPRPIKAQPATSLTATVSAYTAIETCPNRSCVTASGQLAGPGAVACPRTIPLGTKIEIENMGTYTCLDRTAARVDGRYDIWFGYTEKDYQAAIQFGIRKLVVKRI